MKHWRALVITVGILAALAAGLYVAVHEAVNKAVKTSQRQIRDELARRDLANRRASYEGCVANVHFKDLVAVHIGHTRMARASSGLPRDEHFAHLYALDAAAILKTRPPGPGRRPSAGQRCAQRWGMTARPRRP